MDFWDNFSKTISQAADQTVKSTEKLATSAMLKYRISTLKTKLTDYFKTLGELKYSQMTGQEVSDEEFQTITNEITVIKKKLSVLEKRIVDLDDFINCPQCNYRVRRGLEVCPYCEYVFAENVKAEENNEENANEDEVANEPLSLPSSENNETDNDTQ